MYSVNSVYIHMMKYKKTVCGDDFFCPIFNSTIDSWDRDNLSRPAMTLLLQLSTGVNDGDWKLFYFRVCNKSNIFRSEDDVRSALNELVEKGYAKFIQGKLYIRNDKRIEFPEGVK